MLVLPPTYKLPPAPIPPSTVNAPVVVDNDCVVFVIVNISGLVTKLCVTVVYSIVNVVAVIAPVTFKLPPT